MKFGAFEVEKTVFVKLCFCSFPKLCELSCSFLVGVEWVPRVGYSLTRKVIGPDIQPLPPLRRENGLQLYPSATYTLSPKANTCITWNFHNWLDRWHSLDKKKKKKKNRKSINIRTRAVCSICRQSVTKNSLVLWAQSTTKVYIRAENKLHPISKLFISPVPVPQVMLMLLLLLLLFVCLLAVLAHLHSAGTQLGNLQPSGWRF